MTGIADLVTTMAVYPGADPAVAGELARGYAEVSVDRILDASGRSSAEQEDLKAGLDRAIIAARWHNWCPEIGVANGLFDLGPAFHDAALLQVVAMAVPWGWTGVFEAALRHPATVGFGACRLRCQGTTRVIADAATVRIEIDDGAFDLDRCGRGLWLDGAATLRVGDDGLAVTAGHRLDPEILRPEDPPVSVERFAEACATVDAALALLADASGEARGWVDRVTREISVVAPQPGGVTSSRSIATRPGNLLVTAPIDPLALAEALVHEASHQYFALAARLGGFVREERRGELFFSAINGLHRPIGRLALALHAVANMCVLYDETLESGGPLHALATRRLRDLDATARSLADTVAQHRDAFAPHVTGFVDTIVDTVVHIGRKHGLPSFGIRAAALAS